ncbi:CGL56 [Auxenochlorella protothecoides x Auxenochlorella symbiontica]
MQGIPQTVASHTAPRAPIRHPGRGARPYRSVRRLHLLRAAPDGATLELPAPHAASDILNEAMDATAQATQAVGAAPDPSLLQSVGGGTSTFSLPSAPDLRGLQESGGAALQGTRESLERAFQGLGETAGGAAAALKGLTGSAADAVRGLTGTVTDAVQNLTGSTSEAVQGLAQGSSSAVTEEARLAAEQLAATRESLVGSVARYYDLLPPEAQSLLGAGGSALLQAVQWTAQSPPAAAAAFLLPTFLLWRATRGGFSGTLSAEDLAAALAAPGKGGILVVDIREAGTRASEGIPDLGDGEGCAAVALPVPTLDPGLVKKLADPQGVALRTLGLEIARLKALQRGTKLVILDSRNDARAKAVARAAYAAGARRAYFLKGGFRAWRAAGLSVGRGSDYERGALGSVASAARRLAARPLGVALALGAGALSLGAALDPRATLRFLGVTGLEVQLVLRALSYDSPQAALRDLGGLGRGVAGLLAAPGGAARKLAGALPGGGQGTRALAGVQAGGPGAAQPEAAGTREARREGAGAGSSRERPAAARPAGAGATPVVGTLDTVDVPETPATTTAEAERGGAGSRGDQGGVASERAGSRQGGAAASLREGGRTTAGEAPQAGDGAAPSKDPVLDPSKEVPTPEAARNLDVPSNPRGSRTASGEEGADKTAGH